MSLSTFSELFAWADALQPRLGVAAAGGDDPTVLEALAEAAKRGWIRPILTGDAVRIATLARELNIDLAPFRIVAAEEPATAAVAEVRAGYAEFLMKGQIATPALMKAVLNKQTGLRTERVIGQIVLMEIPRDGRSFLLTDTGITIQPTLDQKIDLLRSLTEVARAVGKSPEFKPRIAVMAATEKPTEQMPDSLEAAELQRRYESGEFPEAIVAGPLSFDLAYAVEAGKKKRIASDVVGAADAMLFPSLQAANLTVKAMMYTADCRFGGVLCGTSHPVVFMSRADSPGTRLNSLALSLRLWHFRQTRPHGL